MLATPTGSALIGETFRAFDQAISQGLGEAPDPAVAAALRENAFVFSGFKTHTELAQVAADALVDENGNIRPFDQFSQIVHKLNDQYNHQYLKTEYNQAVQSAQMASKWADFERDKEFINLQYRTANDERVRASHRVLHGVTLPVDDKFWQQYTPPNGWGCRCTVVAVPKDDPDFPVRDAQGSTINGKEVFPTPAYEIFKTNTAKAKKVFPDKHPYLPKSCATCPLNTDRTLSSLTRKKRDCTHCKTREKYFVWKGKKNEWNNFAPAPKFVIDENKYKELTEAYDTQVSLKDIKRSSMEKFDAVRLLHVIEQGVQFIGNEDLKNAWNNTRRSIRPTTDNQIALKISYESFRLILYFGTDKTSVINKHIRIEPSKLGMGAIVSLELLKQYVSMGITCIKADSGLENGGYTWSRMGYYAKDRAEAENVVLTYFKGKDVDDAMSTIETFYQRGRKKDTDPFPMQKLAIKKYFAYLQGSNWKAVLNPQSHQSKGMIRYLRRKIRETERRKDNETNATSPPQA